MSSYIIKNERVIKFYDAHPDIDFQETNLMLVTLLEQASKSSDNNFISISLTNIMADLKTQREEYETQRKMFSTNKTELDNFRTLIQNLQSSITNVSQVQNNLQSTFNNQQSDILANIREIIKNKDNSDEKIVSECIKQQLKSLNYNDEFDKLRILIDGVTKSIDTVKLDQHDIKSHLDTNLINTIREILENKDSRDEKYLHENINNTFKDFYEKFNNTLKLNNSEIKKNSSEDNKALIALFINEYNSTNNHEIQHTKITDFIEKILQQNNTFIKDNIQDSESRIFTNLGNIAAQGQETKLTQEQMSNELHNYLRKYENSSKKGEMSENRIEPILNEIFKNAEVERTADEASKGDFFLKRKEFTTILIENKNYSHNVQKKEIDKFKRDVAKHQIPGIMFSQESGIACKDNYEFEIYLGKYPLLYIHNVNYDYNTIKQSIDLIDHLNKILNKIDELNSNDNQKINIPEDVLISINSEYKEFINTINNLQKIIKSFQKQAEDEICKIKLPSLDKFLQNIYPTTTTVELTPNVCPYCGIYTNASKKGLASHKNACRKKNNTCVAKPDPSITNIVINTTVSSSDEDDDSSCDQSD
jgi:hypothetical protein